MRARKVDDNQKTLVKQIRQLPGVTVRHTHTIGEGFPDLAIGFRGTTYLAEVKDPTKPPSARKLTPDEEKFHAEWTGQIAIIQTIDDVIKILNL